MFDDLEHARCDGSGAIWTVTIARAERANALHSAAHFELAHIFDAFERDASARVAIITGAGDRAFCAGNDLKVQAEGGAMERPPSGFAGLTKRSAVKPIIAAVNGAAIGGGFEMVLACDLAVTAPHARFALPELMHGLVPLAGMHLLPRQVGRKAAMAILLAGKALSAADALDLGLINEIAMGRSALEAARALAERIVRRSPVATATCLDIVRRSLATPDMAAALEASYESLDRLRASADFEEGPKAFAEGRTPSWSQAKED